MENNQTSISDNDEYRNCCKAIANDENLFKVFKQNPIYTKILEHATPAQAEQCIPLILKSGIHPNSLQTLRENDEQGSPTLEDYSNEDFNGISPSTIRYIKVLADLIEIYSSLDNYNIIEIGVGYGGQCKVINDYFNVDTYELVDLEEPLELALKYLSKYDYSGVSSWDGKDKEYDLVISNYAITECDRSVQQFYIDKIIKNSKHGYITCNYISDQFRIDSMGRDEFIKNIGHKDVHLVTENPLTFPGNFVLIW